MKSRVQLGPFEEMVLLTVWVLDGNGYGTLIRERMERQLQRPVSVGALQTALRRLEQKKYLNKAGRSGSGKAGRARLYFAITKAGKHAIEMMQRRRNQLLLEIHGRLPAH